MDKLVLYQNPTHWYTNQGMYSVKLTASSSVCSESITKFDFITVDGVLGVDFTVDKMLVVKIIILRILKN